MGRARPLAVAVAVSTVALLATACLPAAPAAGRGTPVRQVVVIGDSLVWGFFGTSPRLHEPLGRMLRDRRVGITFAGFPAESPIFSWPGNPSWADQMRWWVAARDPDMVIIQNTVMGGPWSDPGVQDGYRRNKAALMDLARSRGAHVYVLANPTPPPDRRDEWRVVERIQAELAAPRGIATIPLIDWMPSCGGATISDGWHFTQKGQDCHALAYTMAVDQLRGRNG